jgi:NitT/TauT family transport system ATP-binding protein
MNSGAAVEFEGISHSYGTESVFDGLDVFLEPGRSYALLGASGTGKTTFLHLMAGLLRPAAGRVLINGGPLEGFRRGTALMTQNHNLLPWKTLADNVALGLAARDVGRAEKKERVMALLRAMGLETQWSKRPRELSGGQAQRGALAAVLAARPDLLLLDEATSKLDAITREDIQDLIRSLRRDYPCTLVAVTHSVEEAAILGDRILLMARGRIVRYFDNPLLQSDGDLRRQPLFHELCAELRGALRDEILRGGEGL